MHEGEWEFTEQPSTAQEVLDSGSAAKLGHAGPASSQLTALAGYQDRVESVKRNKHAQQSKNISQAAP